MTADAGLAKAAMVTIEVATVKRSPAVNFPISPSVLYKFTPTCATPRAAPAAPNVFFKAVLPARSATLLPQPDK